MLQKLTSILFNITEIPIWMNVLLEYILTALLEYIDLLNKFLPGLMFPLHILP